MPTTKYELTLLANLLSSLTKPSQAETAALEALRLAVHPTVWDHRQERIEQVRKVGWMMVIHRLNSGEPLSSVGTEKADEGRELFHGSPNAHERDPSDRSPPRSGKLRRPRQEVVPRGHDRPQGA